MDIGAVQGWIAETLRRKVCRYDAGAGDGAETEIMHTSRRTLDMADGCSNGGLSSVQAGHKAACIHLRNISFDRQENDDASGFGAWARCG